ncbi:glycoside hydrolase family 130 protein [Thermophagus sp. OGC60D27]|uniref:glycoside hydrolase family 130 protein n=1 Tax=Thermophagus sp. OGC60D27 TaxID=3458415 RepID=UPI0040377327
MKLSVVRKKTIIYPNNNRVIARFFFNGDQRATKVIQNILKMPEQEVNVNMNQILREFTRRHRSITTLFKKHYNKVRHLVSGLNGKSMLSENRKLLIGAYFTMEYAIESAALFNPSIVEDPDQSGLEEGQTRVIISLRGTGEGHISSLIFRRAIIDQNNDIHLQNEGNQIDEAELVKSYHYNKDLFINRLKDMGVKPHLYEKVTNQLPEEFNYDQVREAAQNLEAEEPELTLEAQKALQEILWLAGSYTEIRFSLDTDLSERVIFPLSKFEKNGIEDARFVRFIEDDGTVTYYATYTAYDGYTILPKLLVTKDFYRFRIFPIHGKFAKDKNLALFPRRINGKYAMIGRIDGVNNYIMYSDDLSMWSQAEILQEPLYPWELMQIGNGGSPIETEHGWLLITHGVGPVRKYSLGASLLDLKDPTKVIARLKEPLLIPSENERAGYVPNVVYSCGSYIHNGELIIPYAMSDYASSFATVNLNDLIQELKASS